MEQNLLYGRLWMSLNVLKYGQHFPFLTRNLTEWQIQYPAGSTALNINVSIKLLTNNNRPIFQQ